MYFLWRWPGTLLRHRKKKGGPKGARPRAWLAVELLEDRLTPSISPLDPTGLSYDAWRQLPINTDQVAVVDPSLDYQSWRSERVTPGEGFVTDGVLLDPPFIPPLPRGGEGGDSDGVTAAWMQGQQQIGLDRVFANYPYRGAGYSVAVIDTGIDYNHPALGGGFGSGKRVVAGWDFVNNDGNPLDDNGHGTHVAGIIGSADATYSGIAPAVNLIALKVLGADGSGSFGAVEDALRWVINNRTTYNIVAVNMSLGAGNYTSNPYSFLDDEFTTLKSQGVFIAAAAGNSFYSYNSQQGLGYPAVDGLAVAVGAVWTGNYGQVSWQSGAIDYTTAADRITSFTQRSAGLDILAPGALLTSTYLGGTFQTMAGTSMATPVTAGAAALVHQALDASGQAPPSGQSYQDYILAKMQATGASLVDGDDENDNVTNTGLSFKRLDLYAALNTIISTNHAPVLNAIADQTMKAGQDKITATLSASDADNNPLTYTARTTGNAVLTVVGNQLTIDPAAGFVGSFVVDVTVSDGLATASRSFRVTVTNVAPVLGALADRTMKASQDKVTVTLSASDADGDALTYAGRVRGSQAFELDYQLGLSYMGTYYTNYHGAQDKWMQAQSGDFYGLFPNGELRQWLGTITATLSPQGLVATLDAGYYADPSLLWNAAPPPPVAFSVSGTQLTVDPPAGFVGSFVVEATVSDGTTTASRTFTVTVTNVAPVLAAIADQTMKAGQDKLTVTLSASDGDADALTYAGRVRGSQAYELDHQLGLSYMGTYYTNYHGAQDKWLQAQNGDFYGLFPNGELRQWQGTIAATLTAQGLVATLDPSYYADPSLLWNAAAPPQVAFSVAGNQLTVDPPAGFAGSFVVEVTVSDGTTTASRTFTVTVTNVAPVLGAIADQTMPSNQDKLTVTLSASDGDGDTLTYAGRVRGSQAYELDYQLGLSYMGTYYTNYHGAQEKWLQAQNGDFYGLFPNGQVRKWQGSIAATLTDQGLVATLDAGFYADPSLLWNAAPPPAVAFTVTGNQLTVDPPVGYSGSFQVEVSLSDGTTSVQRTFTVTVTYVANSAPVLGAISDQTMGLNQNTLTVNLSASDPDGNALTWTVRTVSSSNRAYQLDQQYGFYYAGSYYTNSWGLDEKWLLGTGDQWYLLLPNGELRRYAGSYSATLGASALLATLPGAIYTDPGLLWNASNALVAVVYQVTGNQLVIDPPAGFAGSFVVEVTVSDGQATASRTFTVTVE